jgi:hypothetical protein
MSVATHKNWNWGYAALPPIGAPRKKETTVCVVT